MTNYLWHSKHFAYLLKALPFGLLAVLLIVFSLPSPGFADSQLTDSDEDVVVTITVNDYDKEIPALSQKNGDFKLGEPVNSDPAYALDENGDTPLAYLIEEKEAQGLSLVWYDENNTIFDWFSSPITKSQTITGVFEKTKFQTRVVFGDDSNTPDLIVATNPGESFIQANGTEPKTPTKSGYEFTGWEDTKTGSAFDFSAPITNSTTVIATYQLVDATQTETVDPAKDIPKQVSGTCYIGSTWSVHPAHFSVSDFDGELKGCAGTGICSLPSAAAPSYVRASYTGTLESIDIEKGEIVYSCHIVPPGAARPDGPRNSLGLIGYQTVSMKCVVKKSFGGYLNIQKHSSNSAISDNNNCYSLENAEFKVFNSKGDCVATLTTNKEGKTQTSNLLPAGTYTVKESKAPLGFALCEPKTVSISPGQTITLPIEDAPLNNLIDIAVEKQDKELQEKAPLGNATLEGAEFKIEYYDGYFKTKEEAQNSGKPTRIWNIKTDENGTARLNEAQLVSGSPFYHDTQGSITLPLGTIVIEETKPSTGYTLSNQVFVQQITTHDPNRDAEDEHISLFQEPTCNEQVIRGDISFTKLSSKNAQRLAGVPFKITSTTTGESHTLLTDENAMANTSSAWNRHSFNTNKGENSTDGIWFGAERSGQLNAMVDNSLCALPYDTYLIEEQPCKANEHLELVSFTFSITRNGINLDLGTIDDNEKQKALIYKIDAQTGEAVLGAELLLENFNQSTEEWEELASAISDKNPWRQDVKPGLYRVSETNAPEGYLVCDPIEFEVIEGEFITQVYLVDEPIELEETPETEEVSEEDEADFLPKTGDVSPSLWVALVMLSCALILAIMALRSKLSRRNKPSKGQSLMNHYFDEDD